MNNFEKIKSMTIDEMVAFLRKADCRNICDYYEHFDGECNCNMGIKQWLLNEVKL